jgi:hypothetical protein
MDDPTRRRFLGLASIAGIGAIAARAGSAETPVAPAVKPVPAPGPVPDAFPSQTPALANAAWDWGFGDWETALGAASHMGNVEIARALLAHGARPSIFSAAMLGQIGVVRAFVEAAPGVQGTPGPHGITLLAHARAGGDAAKPVLEYLAALGGADPVPKNVELPPGLAAACAGVYAFGGRDDDRIEIAVDKGVARFKRSGTAARNLVHLGDHAFHPAGAPAVRVRFAMTGEAQARELTVFDPDLVLTARRVS